jgi:hypothetical protein
LYERLGYFPQAGLGRTSSIRDHYVDVQFDRDGVYLAAVTRTGRIEVGALASA